MSTRVTESLKPILALNQTSGSIRNLLPTKVQEKGGDTLSTLRILEKCSDSHTTIAKNIQPTENLPEGRCLLSPPPKSSGQKEIAENTYCSTAGHSGELSQEKPESKRRLTKNSHFSRYERLQDQNKATTIRFALEKEESSSISALDQSIDQEPDLYCHKESGSLEDFCSSDCSGLEMELEEPSCSASKRGPDLLRILNAHNLDVQVPNLSCSSEENFSFEYIAEDESLTSKIWDSVLADFGEEYFQDPFESSWSIEDDSFEVYCLNLSKKRPGNHSLNLECAKRNPLTRTKQQLRVNTAQSTKKVQPSGIGLSSILPRAMKLRRHHSLHYKPSSFTNFY